MSHQLPFPSIIVRIFAEAVFVEVGVLGGCDDELIQVSRDNHSYYEEFVSDFDPSAQDGGYCFVFADPNVDS